MGVRGAIEFTAMILFVFWVMRMMQVLGASDPPDTEIDQLIDELDESLG